MEECEAICTRIAVMLNGELMCLGSAQHLKSKFPQGFLVAIKLSGRARMTALSPETIAKQLNHFMGKQFPGAYLR